MTTPVRLHPRRALTPAQELIWTAQRLHPEVPLSNMANLSTFEAPIEPGRFVEAVDRVVAGSDALRTTIVEIDGVPHPRTAPEPPSPTEVVAVPDDELDAWMQDRISRPLDVSDGVYDSALLDHGDGRWSWWMNVHHIATDAASSALIFRAVADAYAGEWEPSGTYADLADSLEAARSTSRWRSAADHWAQFRPSPDATPLYRPDRGPTTRAERVRVEMAGPRQEALDSLLGDRFRLLSPDLSMTVALATVVAVYLRGLGSRERVTIGLPIHHRSTREARSVIGPLVELFPVDIDLHDDDTFATVHARVAESVFETLRFAVPGTSPRQAFDVVLNVHGATFGPFGDIGARTRWIHPGHIDAHHRLRIQALDYTGRGELEVALDLNVRTADADHRRRAAGHFGAVLDAMLADPDTPIASVELLGPEERLLLDALIDTGPGSGLDAPAPMIVRDRLRANPTATVVSGPDGDLDGQALDAAIEAVAAALNAAGYGRGDRIGVEIPLGLDAVVVIHGILRAGAAFVPIDPDYPDSRRQHLRRDSGAALVLRALGEALAPPASPAASEPSGADPPVTMDDLAYVIYTSGSSGEPKGVPITHSGLAEYLGFAFSSYVGSSPPVMPLYTSLSFDLTITTLFLPLLAGGTMTVHPDGGLVALREIVDQRRATILKATPSHLELLVRMIEPDHPLSTLVVGGEAFLTELATRLVSAFGPGLAVYNEYGPTEAVVGCMIHRYDPEADTGPEVPIGRPAPGVALRICDPDGNLVPVGVEGELRIGRPGMTEGYLGRDDLNRDRFVDDAAIGRLYRSGDRVRLDSVDRMIYLGRLDEQIKVRGVRLEPGEIEAAATGFPGVRRAVAALWQPDVDHVVRNCVRCGLGSDVPGVVIDGDGVCSACHEFDIVEPQAAEWFRDESELAAELARAAEASAGDYDVIHLLSGGKDSTYALYRLVEMGARVLALTLDTGYLSEGAMSNSRRATDALGVDLEVVTVEGMEAIFRDSLERYSNVCNGCYKTIYTVALQRAEQLGVPAIVTGLSRGQFFETRLVPGLFGADRFDVGAIDAAVLDARKAYHRTPDAVSEHLDVEFLADGSVLDRIRFIDFYRYVDVELTEIYEALESSGTWERPADTGRSTNCLINSAGIFVHKLEQGHHNYAVPYSWDVRLGHKTRAEALEELDDPMDEDELATIAEMLADVGYEPRPAEVLTLWVEADADLDVDALRASLEQRLPEHARPRAVEVVLEIPLTPNGKVDRHALPAPAARRTMTTAALGRVPDTPTEHRVAAVWETVLGVEGMAADADFFGVGGTSLHALEMIIRLSDAFGVVIPESIAFTHRTVGDLAAAIDDLVAAPEVGRGRNPIPELDPDEPLPLSAGEEAMLYEWWRDPADHRYNIARLYRIPHGYDRDRLDRALRTVVARHANLRTSYGADRRPLAIDDAIRTSEVNAQVAPLQRLAEELNRVQFDLVNGPLLTMHHLTTSRGSEREEPAVLLRAHHIVTDARSLDVLWSQLDRVYRSPDGDELPPLTTTYAAHGVWQRQRRPEPDAVWPVDADTELGDLALRTPRPEPDGYVVRDASVTLADIRRSPGATPFATALTALGITVAPYVDRPRVEIAVTASVRDHPDLDEVVGYFVNPLPLLVDLDRAEEPSSLASHVDDVLAESLQNRSVPFAEVVAAARGRGAPPPKARLMLAVEHLGAASLDGVPVEHTILASGTAVTDLTFFAYIRDEAVELGCEYRGTVVSRSQAEHLLERFDRILRALADGVDRLDDELAPSGLALTGDALDRPVPAPDRIQRVISERADEPAVRSGGRALTYGELDDRARALAGRLRAVGVGPGDRVAVVLERSVDLPVAILAAWFVGASYVPIDVQQPSARVAELIAAAGVRAAISSGEGHPGLSDVITLDTSVSDPAVLPVSRIEPTGAGDEAYLIFTSGSTGRPKGVPVSHGNLAASLTARLAWYPERVGRYLLLSSAGFDSSVAGLFWTLADGGELVIPTEGQVHDVDALLDLIERAEPTHTLCVPSLYGAMIDRHGSVPTSFETVIVAGEACPRELVERHFALGSGAELVNEYGPTEATVWASAHRCRPDDEHATVPIGGPIPGVTLRVVDSAGRPLPADVAGELWISGPGVVSGYLDGPDDRAFVRLADGGQAYRTGDRVVARADGEIEFVGRVDDQLSIGGVRIEPAEVEQALTTLPGIHAAAVARRGDQLIAWVEGDAGDDIRETLGHRLAPTHLPARVLAVDTLPRTANGKIDRRALADLAVETSESPDAHADPDDPLLGTILDIWREAFDGRPVAPSSDFFELGGDSLRAVVLVSLLERDLGRRVGIGELIDAPTPAALASRLGAVARETTDAAPATEAGGLIEWLRRRGDRRPLVVLPPGGGNLLRYAPLVNALDPNVPVLGIRLPGADARTAVVEGIEAQAAVMLDALDHAIPQGPYRLLGWSTGGLLAWELARLLSERGDEVELVGLVDTFMSGVTVGTEMSIGEKYRSLLRDEGIGAVASEGVGRLLERADFARARRRYRRARDRAEMPAMADAERRLGPVIRRAAAGYRPPALTVPTVYFAASETEPHYTHEPWSALLGELDLVMLDGVHYIPEDRCIIGEQRVEALVVELERRLVAGEDQPVSPTS